MAINAFLMIWNDDYFYIFPPFRLIGYVIAKIRRGRTEAVGVVLDWPT